MALQKSIDNLKQKPKDERTAVASGISIVVGAVLFIAWVIYFFQKIQSGAVAPTLQAGNDFSQQSMQQAQAALQQEGASSLQDLVQLREQINSQQQGPVQQTTMQQVNASSFGAQSSQ